jgi:hypothetical protein
MIDLITQYELNGINEIRLPAATRSAGNQTLSLREKSCFRSCPLKQDSESLLILSTLLTMSIPAMRSVILACAEEVIRYLSVFTLIS